jgi:hypothetical protein
MSKSRYYRDISLSASLERQSERSEMDFFNFALSRLTIDATLCRCARERRRKTSLRGPPVGRIDQSINRPTGFPAYVT